MAIQYKRLKDYIFRNTESNVRSRANSITVKKIDLSKDKESAKARVKGDKLYEVHFYGLQTGMISSSCTCPYEWGNVCKHEVAVANEIDVLLDKPKTLSSVKKDGVFTFSFKDIKEFNIDVILNDTTRDIFRQGDSDLVINTYEKERKIYLDIKGEQWYSNTSYITEIEILQNKLKLVSKCKCHKHRLCKHQVSALQFIHFNLTHLLLDKKELEKVKEKLLEEYGFTLKDDKYKSYFKFENTHNGLQLIPLKEGITKKMELTEFHHFSEVLHSLDITLRNQLPYLPQQKEEKKPQGIAFTFQFQPLDEYRIPTVIVNVIKGNLNKEQTLLSTKLVNLEAKDFLYEKEKYSKEQQETLEEAFCLSEEYLDNLNFRTFLSANYIQHKLQTLIPKLKDKIVYKWDYNYHKISKNDLTPIKLHIESANLEFTISEEEDFFITETTIVINNRRQKLKNTKIGNNYLFVQRGTDYYLNKNIDFCNTLQFFREQPIIRTIKSDFDNFYQKILAPLEEKHIIKFHNKNKKVKKQKVSVLKKQIFLSEVDDFIVLKPFVEYQNLPISIFSKRELLKKENNTTIQIIRDTAYEKHFENQLREIHINFKDQQTDFFFLTQEEFINNTWFLNAFETFKEKEIEVFGFKDLKLKYNQHKPNISININSDIDWFDVNIEVAFGDQVVSLRDLKKNIINKDKYIRLKDNTIGILPEEWMKKYTHLFRSGEVKKDSVGVSKYQFSVVDTLYEELENENNLFDDHIKIKQKLQNFEAVEEVAKPRGLKATLRDYQKEGLKWLNFLDDFNLGGCLADDMGLGKTLQIISFIKHLKTKRKEKIPHLIIVPTSLIFNWQDEVAKFCPSLKITVLTGVNRTKDTSGFKNYDIVLSTYGIVMNDINYLKEYQFNYIILDESQAIKNPASKRFKSVRLLKAKNRLVLTGTPIENNTFDLYAQMTFVNPGLLGGMQHFKKEYSTAIDKDKNKEVAKELKNLIDPFLLRRTKEQVATELPPKTEQFLYCTMKDEQRKVYEAYKNKYKDYLLGKIEDDGLGKSKMYVLEGLTKLRQICDSPSLLNDNEEYTNQSIKIDEIIRHITEKTNKHKILIFSQFVKMLALIKNRLNELNINYEYLDGKTKNRQEKVNNFQENEDVRVFLISLKAGGTGLNLTAADYVYIVDPWWNPAVEAQAIDRCYRIGQKKNVTAFKMICKDTIEEKIVTHQQNKKQVSNQLIQTEDSFVKSLTKESVAALFE